MFDYKDSNSMTFYANYYDSANVVSSAAVIVDGTSYDLTLDSGNSTMGTWKSKEFTAGSKCRSYYFEFKWNGGSAVFPNVGSFNTFGEGSCATDYATDKGSFPQNNSLLTLFSYQR